AGRSISPRASREVASGVIKTARIRTIDSPSLQELASARRHEFDLRQLHKARASIIVVQHDLHVLRGLGLGKVEVLQ
ncbi:MAG TPA: hypothetical protein DEV93_16960, partial [Chloroflexi bacterium]|nr:hypothetical protein [Chloroflexota bacterium]